MKKSTLVLLFGSFSSAMLLAQPTLTSSGIVPVVGNSITTNTANYVNQGSSGANQTWNLGSMTSSGSSVSTGVTPSSTPNGSQFSQATVAMGASTTYAYYKGTSAAWQYYGVDNGSITMPYSNPEDQLHFPFAYNDTYTDTWAATFTNNYTFYRTGSTVVTADGWGTLTTPDGTFGNVMRVHFVQTYQDSTNIASSPFIITYQNDEYMWYLNGNHYPIAAVYTLTSSAGSPITGGFYLGNVVSGIEESSSLLSYALSPNPANDHFDFTFSVEKQQHVEIGLYNVAGQLVNTPVTTEATAGENRMRIDVATLPDGVYMARVTIDGTMAAAERVVISR